MDTEALKRALHRRLTDKDRYPGEKLTLRIVMERAAEIALATVDAMVATTVPQPAQQRRRPGAGRPDSDRLTAAQEKRQRLLRVLKHADGPMRMGHIGREAMLTPGECSWLLKSTPGVVQVGRGVYTLAGEG